MNTYIVMLDFTEWGIASIKDSPGRSATMSAIMEKHGARIKDYYLTMGEHDFVVIFEATDDRAMAKVLFEIGRLGAVKTRTMRAFSRDEFKDIVGELPARGIFEDLKKR
ncbi:MAG: GYD domain-containing protein [Alphaproteobacteria bacterium]